VINVEDEVAKVVQRVRADGGLKTQWRARLERFARAKQGVRMFCAADAVSEPAFFWRRRFSAQAGGVPTIVVAQKKATGFGDSGVARARLVPVRDRSTTMPASVSAVRYEVRLGMLRAV